MEIEVLAFQHLYHCLEIIDLFRPDPHLVFLDLRLHLQFRLFYAALRYVCPFSDMPC